MNPLIGGIPTHFPIELSSRMKRIALLIFSVFFIVNTWLLPHYGMNWDEPIHDFRGQAYLHYFLTGKKDYKDLPPFQKYYQKDDTIFFDPIDKEKNKIPKRSMNQDNQANFGFFLKDFGHPPFSDIVASISNFILFQQLRLINDVDSYHVYSVFLASVLVGAVFFWTSQRYSKFAGLIALLALSSYPLFLGELHNNIKDVPETVFYSLALITLYEAITQRKKYYVLLSSLFCGFAFGTKFNVIFLPFIILPWTFIYIRRSKKPIKKYITLLPSVVLYPVIVIIIFYISWPFLWNSPISNFLKVVGYYRDIGINPGFDTRFITYFGINTYAAQWIAFSTPLVTLFFSFFGLVFFLTKGLREKKNTSLLIFFWLLIPIGRVSMPHAGIYGGVRQIMEFVPAMAIMAGLGAMWLRDTLAMKIKWLSPHYRRLIFSVFIMLSFLPIVIKLISIHPNEAVYFNPLIGGLKGAKERNLPEWGQNLGSVNKQGIMWLNRHAETHAKLATNFGLGSSIPAIFLRSDLLFANGSRSTMERKGEYIIGLTHQSGFEHTYFFQYLDKFLDPVYEVSVDGVPILRICKNDLQHTKQEYKNIILLSDMPVFSKNEGSLTLDIGKKITLAKMVIQFTDAACFAKETIKHHVDTVDSNPFDEGSVEISPNGTNWNVLDGDLRAQSLLSTPTRQANGDFIYYFAAIKARYIRINFNPEDLCFKDIENVAIYGLPEKG